MSDLKSLPLPLKGKGSGDRVVQVQQIWAPWRIQYILQADEKNGCFLCQKPKEDSDESNLVLHRGTYNFIILNSYPYNPGHLLLAPYRHVGRLDELTDLESREHFDMLKQITRLLAEAIKPAGFNIGMNLGKIAGAGLEDHIHTHIVPRWQGDTNFMPVIAGTKVMSQALVDVYQKLKEKLSGFF